MVGKVDVESRVHSLIGEVGRCISQYYGLVAELGSAAHCGLHASVCNEADDDELVDYLILDSLIGLSPFLSEVTGIPLK